MVICDHCKVTAMEVRPEFLNSPNDGKAFLFCNGVILLGGCQRTTSIGNDPLPELSITLKENSADSVATCVCVEDSGLAFIKVAEYRARR